MRSERPHPDRSSVDIGDIVRTGAAIVAVVAVVVAIAVGWHRSSFDRPTVPRPFAVEPGTPPLQTDPAADRRAYERDKAALLTRTEWIDRERGIVRIPIDVAMRKLAQRTK